MHTLAPAELLQHWESGTTQPRWLWAHGLLRAAFPELGEGEIEALTVGERDTRLLELREALFGADLPCRSECPACRAPVEMELKTSELRPAPEADADDATLRSEATCRTPLAAAELHLSAADFTVHFRAPNVHDLAEAARDANAPALRAFLLDRCVRATRGADAIVALADLPPSTLDQVIAGMSAADPQADLQLQLGCPACGHAWSETFDIVSYLWTELDGWVLRLLHDVHLLASAYGWTERDVLALSAQRRARYLELLKA